MRVEQVTDPVASHGEGPVWSPGWGGLRWVDMLAGDVLSHVALAHLPSVDEAAALVRVNEVVHPDPDTAGLYRRLRSFAATAEAVETLPAWRQDPAPADRSGTDGNAEELCRRDVLRCSARLPLEGPGAGPDAPGRPRPMHQPARGRHRSRCGVEDRGGRGVR